MVNGLSPKSIVSFFTQGNKRTLRAKKNISVSFISKGISILISFLIVPLTLGYVGKVEYGIWMTISSIISWFAFFDIGLGNGLRNKLAEALAKDDKETAKVYISSTFALIAGIATLMFVGFFVAANYISWNAALNTNVVANNELFKIVVTVFFFFCIGFVMKVLSSILQAMQRYAINNILSVIAQMLGLIAIFILVKTTNGSLFNLCLVYGSKTAIVLLIASIFLFSGSLKEFRPRFHYINIKRAIPLMNLGIWFFINQILYLIITQTSVILVVQFFGPEDVTVFNLAKRYMTLVSMLYIMVLTPFLSAFTEAYTKKEFGWIKSTIKKINSIWLMASFGTIILIFTYKLFFRLWVGDEIIIPVYLIITLGISSILSTWSSTFTLFLNGIGKIKLQFRVLFFQALLFFPLSYLFFKFNFGLSSLFIPVILFGIVGAFFFTIQFKKIINQTALGIWNK
ncbi:MAG: oligosaccharide flippase family protein [Prolixibacteraceae bacterium]|jgi:O-antigen/teichoic acid export membrane protein|nr:oligosaccharide flippase family protein [Prolixibacteraceae bacterium]